MPNNIEYDISGIGYDFNGKVTGGDINLAKQIAFLGVINNESYLNGNKFVGDSIDTAFKVLGKKLNKNTGKIKILETIPYESENKYSAVFYEKDKIRYCTVKGSLEIIKSFCKDINLTQENINSLHLENQNEFLAQKGYRVIALANCIVDKKKTYNIEDIKDLTFMGMVGFIDPVRKDATTSIKKCHNAGIKVLMITGDHPLTAFNVAKELNIANNYNEVITGTELEKKEKYIDEIISKFCVFARVNPIQKLKIVEALKRKGEYVALIGDGVNDAPAIKSANIGISLGSGTDIARETADMIILDDNFKSIVNGIKEGRVAYANIRKIILFLISCGLAEVVFFCLSIIMNLNIPLLSIQLLWLNVVTNGIQDFALSFEKAESDTLKEKPRSPKESIFNKALIKQIIFSGFVIGIIVFFVWYYLLKKINMNIYNARSYIMILMVFIQNMHVLNCRSEKKSIFSIPLKTNKLIIFSIIFSIILQIIIMNIKPIANILKINSIPFLNLIYLFLLSLLILIIMEIYKMIYRRKVSIN